MHAIHPTRLVLKSAADAVVEFALISFEERFLLWNKDVNLGVAQRIWNAFPSKGDPLLAGVSPEPELAALIERLAEARASRWHRTRVRMFGLDVHVVAGELVFDFDLTWDEGESFHPCEITVDGPNMHM